MTDERSPDDRGCEGLPPRRRVVLVTPGFSASESDWCIPILRDFAEGLAEKNDVSIVALRYPGTKQGYRVDGIPVTPLGGGTRRGIPKIGLLLRAVASISREVRRRSVDVIHAFWAHEPGTVACIAGRLTGVPVVVTVMGGELAALPEIEYGGILAPGNRMLARYCLRRANRVVSLCRSIHRIASDQVAPSRLCQIDFGVPTDRFVPDHERAFSSEEQNVRFIAVGSLVPVKGHDVILRAFALCHAELPGTTLDLVGEGPLREMLEQQARDLGIGSAVRFAGAVDHGRLAGRYRQADVLILGSWWEGAPQVAHEALACGIPIIGTAVGIIPELTDAARCVPVGDAEALGREMARVAASTELRSRMAVAAAAAVRPIEDGVADHERLYDSICRHDPASNEDDRDD